LRILTNNTFRDISLSRVVEKPKPPPRWINMMGPYHPTIKDLLATALM
jgi:hypothetical protein